MIPPSPSGSGCPGAGWVSVEDTNGREIEMSIYLAEENERLKARIAELEAENAALKKELDELKAKYIQRPGTLGYHDVEEYYRRDEGDDGSKP